MRILALGLAFVSLLLAESAGGLRWNAPAGWQAEGPATFRAATYSIPGSSSTDKTECIVYFFGAGQGGSVEANLQRWKGQFTRNGQPAEAKVSKGRLNGIAFTTIDIAGVYTATGGQARAGQSPLPGYRMVATVAEGPEGNIFIRLIGPEKAVAAAQPSYERLLNSLHRN